MNLQTDTGAMRLALNMKFLAIRLLGILVRMVPFKAFFLNSSGIIIGLLFMFLRIGQWRAIKRFARHTGSPLLSLLYIMKYFIQQGKDGVWGYVFCEAPSVLDRYVTMQNIEPVEDAIAGGKGVIVLAAHYGPAFYAYSLSRMHFDVKVLLSKYFVRHLHNAGTLVLKPLRSEKVTFLNNSGVVLVAQKDEKYLVKHVRKGGWLRRRSISPARQKRLKQFLFSNVLFVLIYSCSGLPLNMTSPFFSAFSVTSGTGDTGWILSPAANTPPLKRVSGDTSPVSSHRLRSTLLCGIRFLVSLTGHKYRGN